MNKDDMQELKEGYKKAKVMHLDSFFFQGTKMPLAHAKKLLGKYEQRTHKSTH